MKYCGSQIRSSASWRYSRPRTSSPELKDEYKMLLAAGRKRTSDEKLMIDLARAQQRGADAEERIQGALAHFDKVIGSLSMEDQKELMQLLIKEVVVAHTTLRGEPLWKGAGSTPESNQMVQGFPWSYSTSRRELNLAGLSSETEEIGCGTRTRT